MAFQRGGQIALGALPVNGHAENVGGALQEGNVVGGEFALGAAVDFKHAIRLAVALQNHVHGAADAVLEQELGGAEALFVFEVIGDDGLAGAQGVAGGRGHVGADGCRADDTGVPTDAGAYQEAAFRRHEFQDFGEFGRQALGGQPGGQVEQLRKRRSLQRAHAKLRQNLLLTDPQAKRLGRQVGRRRAFRLFGNELGRSRVKGNDAGHISLPFRSKLCRMMSTPHAKESRLSAAGALTPSLRRCVSKRWN